MVTWISQRPSSTPPCTSSDINFDLAQPISSSLHRDSVRANLRRVRLAASRDGRLVASEADGWAEPWPDHEEEDTPFPDGPRIEVLG